MTEPQAPKRKTVRGTAWTAEPVQIDMIWVQERDWHRIRREVSQLENPIGFAAGLGWAAVGVFVSACFFLLGWVATFDNMPAAQKADYAWTQPVCVAVIIASLAVAIVCFVLNRRVGQDMKKDAQAILTDMDSIHATHQPAGPPRDSSPNS